MMDLLRQAVAVLPQLVEQLEVGRPPDVSVAPLIKRAHAMAGMRDHAVPQPQATSADFTQTAVTAEQPVLSDPLTVPASMDPALHDIFAKEVAGHLAEIRDYIANCDNTLPPYAVSEALHRACHTLSGASKTAGARHSIKIAEPLNHYVRKLYDNGASLPSDGLQLLKDAVAAIEYIIANINESTVFFSSQADIAARLQQLEQRLDSELTARSAAPEATGVMPMPQFDNDSNDVPEPQVEVLTIVDDVPADEAAEDDELWIDLTTDDLEMMLSQPLSSILAQGAEPAVDATEMPAVSDGQELFVDETMQEQPAVAHEPEPEPESQTIVETPRGRRTSLHPY
jgi:chemosensory pili system protein ChpA (sensor histidine kinase/response regulator)